MPNNENTNDSALRLKLKNADVLNIRMTTPVGVAPSATINGVKVHGELTSADLGLVGSDEKGAPMGVATLDENGKIPEEQIPYAPGSGGSGLPPGGNAGDLLTKRSGEDGDAEWITPASSAEEDNTRPITAAAVYTTVGNINALLATI